MDGLFAGKNIVAAATISNTIYVDPVVNSNGISGIKLLISNT